MSNKLKVLLLDIETAPMQAYVWGLFDQNIGLNQIKQDWFILAWAAKWAGAPASKTIYMDQRDAKDIRSDKAILQALWFLLDEADVIITQNGRSFDAKKINARMILNGMKPPSSYQHIDTYRIAKKLFGFTSNKLEYMTSKLCTKYKKLTHKKFPGFELWEQCMRGNKQAWKEMEKYNRYDVLSLEELYNKLQPWDSSISFNTLHGTKEIKHCACGSTKLRKNGFSFTSKGKFQRFLCLKCGSEQRATTNLLTVKKKKEVK